MTLARLVSVGGGKGGVGKSVVAANLAVAMAEQGVEVVLVDADLGAPNQHTLFGIDRPGPTLQSLLTHEIDSLEQARRATLIPHLTVVAGASAAPGAANIPHAQKQRLLRQIRRLGADVIVVDVGAGVAFNALDFFNLGDQHVVVTSAQLTSVQNAYAFLKGAVYRRLVGCATTPAQRELVQGSRPDGSTARMVPLIQSIGAVDPAFAAGLTAALGAYRARIIGNQVIEATEELVFHAVSRMISDFLGVPAPVMGALRTSRALHDSINRRRPYLLDARGERAAHVLREMAQVLLQEVLPPPTSEPADVDPLETAAA